MTLGMNIGIYGKSTERLQDADSHLRNKMYSITEFFTKQKKSTFPSYCDRI